MKNPILRRVFLFGLLLFAPVVAPAVVSAEGPEALEIMRQAHLLLFYAADDGAARVEMEITDRKGRVRSREFTIARVDLEDGGEQRYFTWFHAPADVRRTTFMAWKRPDADDARWIYLPALDLVKPISASDRHGRFVGSDFRYEDVSGRHWSLDEHSMEDPIEFNGVACHVVRSIPREDDAFASRLSWIRQSDGVLLRQDSFNRKGELIQRLDIEEWNEIDGFLTASVRRMETPPKGSFTIVRFSGMSYNIGLKANDFKESILRRPPAKLREIGKEN